MRLFIAEKPSGARAIAAELGVSGRKDGYIECGCDKVTWCFGHMLEQAGPDEYTPDDVPRVQSGRKVWRVEELPILPPVWILKPKEEARKQLGVIGRLISQAREIVNAGDPDREGQLLVDEVLEHFCSRLPVRRFWVSAQDSVSVRRGLAALKDNQAYAGWADAARGRQRADWLIGMNLSRAYTLRAQRGGSRVLLTVGRVQTPTLALVVNRDREIEAFQSVLHHTLVATLQHAGGSFRAVWKPGENQPGLDSEGRLVDAIVADSLVAAVRGQHGRIAEYRQEARRQHQPLAFSLSDITALASARFGYSAQEVLDACQALYETHKLTSYPRTDCGYLPESQHADAIQVLQAIRHVNPELSDWVDRADPRIKSRTWDDSRVTAHHGIVPTMHPGSKAALNPCERHVYELIVRAYLAQFYPPHEYRQTTVDLEIGGQRFAASGKVVTHSGWREVCSQPDEDAGQVDDESDRQALPAMIQGDTVVCEDTWRKDAKTRPPPHLTEGTLIRAMENIHQHVSHPEHKKMLREGDGIGTSATRASILSELKRRGFLALKGRQIVSTTLGRSLIDALPEVVKSPVLTALHERMLKGVEQGTAGLSAFTAKQEAFIRDQVAKANDGAVNIAGGKEAAPVSALHKCMACGHGLVRRPGKLKGHCWWGCSHYPECQQTYPDLKGRPDYGKGRSGPPSR